MGSPSSEKMKASPQTQKAFYIITAAALLFAALAVYSPAGTMSFIFDDKVTIIKNRKIQSGSFVQAISENPFRSLVNITFALQADWHRPGEPGRVVDHDAFHNFLKLERENDKRMQYYFTDPVTGKSGRVLPDMKRGYIYPLPRAWPFRLFNLAVHAVSSLLLGMVVFRLRPQKSAAFLAAAAFLLHPLATESVNYITARFDLMAFAFSLAAVYFHLLADDRPSCDWIAAAFFVLALGCKESAASLPVAVLLLDAARGRPQHRVLFGLALSAIYVVLRLQWMIVLDNPAMDKLAWPAYVMVEQRVFWMYLAKCVYPLHLNFEYNIEPRTAVDVVFCAVHFALLLYSLQLLVLKFTTGKYRNKKNRNKRERKLGGPAYQIIMILSMAWVLVCPTLLVPLADTAREHRAYPLVAMFAGALFAGVLPAIAENLKQKKAVPAAAIIIILLFALQSFSRNRDWKNKLTLLRDSMRKSPEKSRVIYNYANELKWRGRFSEALFWYKRHQEKETAREDTRRMIKMLEKRLDR